MAADALTADAAPRNRIYYNPGRTRPAWSPGCCLVWAAAARTGLSPRGASRLSCCSWRTHWRITDKSPANERSRDLVAVSKAVIRHWRIEGSNPSPPLNQAVRAPVAIDQAATRGFVTAAPIRGSPCRPWKSTYWARHWRTMAHQLRVVLRPRLLSAAQAQRESRREPPPSRRPRR